MRSLAPLAAAILIGTTAFAANAGVVEDRKANFKANNASMRAIGAAIGGGDFETVTREAERIAACPGPWMSSYEFLNWLLTGHSPAILHASFHIFRIFRQGAARHYNTDSSPTSRVRFH